MHNFKDNHSNTKHFINFVPSIYLELGRIHEIYGPAKKRIAMLIGAKIKVLIVWIRPNWEEFIINTDSISDWFSASRLLLLNTKNKNDLFSSKEELLRSGLAMTSGIRSNYNKLTLGLILCPNRGTISIESRWDASTLTCWKHLTDKHNRNLKQIWYIKKSFSRTETIKK